MKDARNKRRHGRWLAAAAGLIILAGFVLFRISAPRIQDKLENRIVETITSYLGSSTKIGSVRLTWDSLVLNDIVLPVDSNGSSLRIEQVSARLRPTRLLGKSFKPEQMISSVCITAPDVFLSTEQRAEEKRVNDKPWLPQFTLPPQLFSTIRSFTELSEITFERGSVSVRSTSVDTVLLCEFDGIIRRSPDGLYLSMGGCLLKDSTSVISATGDLSESKRSLDLHAALKFSADKESSLLSQRFALKATGNLSVDITVTESDIRYMGAADFTDADLSWGSETLHFPDIRATLQHDTVRLDSTVFKASSVYGFFSGMFRLSSMGKLDIRGRLHTDDLSRFKVYEQALASVEGDMDAAYSIGGTIAEPRCEAQIQSKALRVFGQDFYDFRTDIHLSPLGLEVCSLEFADASGSFGASGNLTFNSRFSWNGSGEWIFQKTPSVLGWRLGVKRLRFTGSEYENTPVISVTALDSCGRELCTAAISRSNEFWILNSLSPGKGSSEIYFEPTPDQINFSAKNAHFLIGSVIPDLEFSSALQQLDLQFAGGMEQGELSCDIRSQSDTTGLWSRIARELQFSGTYNRSTSTNYSVCGKWSGTAGNGDPFEGQAQLAFSDRVLEIEQLFIDAVGSLRGTVDMRSNRVDMELTVSDLSLEKLPISSELLSRFEARGTLAGHLHAQGSLDQPKWDAGFAMTDGSVFGVPGYWMNLDASGTGLSAEIRS